MTTRFPPIGIALILACCAACFPARSAQGAVIYFVSGSAKDDGLKAHLANDLGHTVLAKSGNDSSHNYANAVASGADLIIISGTIGSPQASGKGFHTSRIPLVNYEPYSYDDYGWTLNNVAATNGVNYGDSQDGHQDLKIENHPHPITAGFSPGPLPVYDTADGAFSYGVPGPAADVLATSLYPGYPTAGNGVGAATIFVYERGDALRKATGDNSAVSTARARYVGFFLSDYGTAANEDIYGELNANGQRLVDQAVAYALAPPDPIAHWKFEQDLSDAVGDNHGTGINNASITHAPGETLFGRGTLKLRENSGQ